MNMSPNPFQLFLKLKLLNICFHFQDVMLKFRLTSIVIIWEKDVDTFFWNKSKF